MTSGRALVEQLASVWESIGALGDALDEEEWNTPTECPGWSVQDNVTHLFGIEAMLAGRPTPKAVTETAAAAMEGAAGGVHDKGGIGALNEAWVDAWRARSGAETLAEFRAITGERLAQLRPLDDDGFETPSWTPMGPGTIATLLPFRIFDSWVHEQDMRRALGRPGDVTGAAADNCYAQLVGFVPYVVGKKVGAPTGTTLVLEISGAANRSIGVEVDGRARLTDPVPEPTARLSMDTDTFVRLMNGRGDVDEIMASGAVHLSGDQALGRAFVDQANVLF
ncbi:MAG: hypothetical protein JWL73_1232 [Actinomycetia bacterium]|nr:hypothetical protein [Actinomycetes bacterium]